VEKKINEWIERGFFFLASAILIYCANQIGSLNQSVNELNNKLSTYITKHELQSTMLKDHEARLRILERTK
jgi:hypothetical protein